MDTVPTPVVPPLVLSEAEIRFYREEGYLFLPGLIDSQRVLDVCHDVLDVMYAMGATEERLRQAEGSSDKLIQAMQYLEGSALDQFVNSTTLRDVASQLVEGPATMYLPFTAVKSGGGGGVFHFHQDNQYTRFDGPAVNIWCALTKMTPDNGCLQVVPRSHLDGTLTSVENPDGDGHRTVAEAPPWALPLRMNPGDAVAFSRLTLHGSGPNSTREARVAYAVQFHRDDVRRLKDGEWVSLKEVPVHANIQAVREFSKMA